MPFDYSHRVTANLVEDQGYWEKACKAKWNVCDVSLYDGDWKRMYFERYLEGKIASHYFLYGLQRKKILESYVDALFLAIQLPLEYCLTTIIWVFLFSFSFL